MKNKNLLAENMLRFRAKNLSETAKRKIVKLAEIITEQNDDGTASAKSTLETNISLAIPTKFNANNVSQLAQKTQTVIFLSARTINLYRSGSGPGINPLTTGEGNVQLGSAGNYALGSNSVKFIINMGNYYIALGMDATGDIHSPTNTNQIIGHAFTIDGTGNEAAAKILKTYKFKPTFIDSCKGLSYLMNKDSGPGVGTVGAAVIWFHKYLAGGNMEPWTQLTKNQQDTAVVRNYNEMKNMTDDSLAKIGGFTPGA